MAKRVASVTIRLETIADDGFFWADDGLSRIAYSFQERANRFFKNGIANRCEKLAFRYLRDLVFISEGDFIINFGANIGELALRLSGFGAKILVIEPDSGVIPALTANSKRRDIDVAPIAAWNEDCERSIYIASENADTSFFNQSDCIVEVTARKIDTLMAQRSVPRVRLIVGDAEGAEPEVLEGARKTLGITDYVSVCASAERQGQRTIDACASILRDASFDIIHRDEQKFSILIGKSRRISK